MRLPALISLAAAAALAAGALMLARQSTPRANVETTPVTVASR